MNSTVSVRGAAGRAAQVASSPPITKLGSVADALYLAFRLSEDLFAVEILGVREIVEYSLPTRVPMMPPAVRGVINLRGAVVPIVDLSVRFGREPTEVGRRTCFVIVEVLHAGILQVLGLMVDGVNAVLQISTATIEPPPAFGMGVSTDYIAGMARVDGRFITLLDMVNALSIDEMATVADTEASPV